MSLEEQSKEGCHGDYVAKHHASDPLYHAYFGCACLSYQFAAKSFEVGFGGQVFVGAF